MKYLRWLLFPLSLIYGLVVSIRNWCYDADILKSTLFNFPVICIGNLDVGGAGKSPMAEYLIRLLKADNKVATLSRGYGRSTTGYLEAGKNAAATQVGDEPAQFKNKFTDITVAVCANRVTGIKKLIPGHDVVILDDAYQHRAVKPGFSILLFDYTRINEPRLMLPAGNLREPFLGRWRADVLVVSKCPPSLSHQEKQQLTERLKPFPFQKVYFTSIAYQPLQSLNGAMATNIIDADTTVFLLSGIANTTPLLQHLQGFSTKIIHHKYPDHHQFSLKNITKLADEFEACTAEKKLLITTEKDAQRLGEQQLLPLVNKLPFLVLPIGVKFIDGEQEFAGLIKNYVREYSSHNSIH
ncbi:tetraacyldisaccharide 4'-kinase [Mucilaginibacter sp. UR6-1]|uniref:tetraacyldisaccharide 4'-kinase n=1 Tax=Mucilaginibacter sp. UR6-1 TaxID=1435643 RepID=UPI001E3C84AA|nr:tetraacyldisaccharide 4'-kinase [Mucilaginibacter sp. UR6-1]MCC8408414.1 tetraacyldisaccharide 4'-kinase [Mucilaginibacter sp. UR6-1]